MTAREASRGAGTSKDDQGAAARSPARGARPVLVINPPQDRAFTAAAEGLLDDGLPSLSRFQEALRITFPIALVRARDLSGEVNEIWYLFRDGRWVNGQDGNHRAGDV